MKFMASCILAAGLFSFICVFRVRCLSNVKPKYFNSLNVGITFLPIITFGQ